MIEFWAEAGPCENSTKKAIKYVRAAKEAGASALKVQWYRPETIASPTALRYDHTSGPGETQRETFANSIYPYERWEPVIEEARLLDLEFIPAVFDLEAVEVAKTYGLKTIKIASGDITYHELIEAAALSQPRLAISTGGSFLPEIKSAVAIAEAAHQVVLLACHLEYPTPLEQANIGRIWALQQEFHWPWVISGFSDHTPGISTIPLAVAAGVSVIEKHFTLEANHGYDSDFALTPNDLRNAILSIQRTVAMMGDASLEPTQGEAAARLGARRSLVLTKSLKAGSALNADDLSALRPHVEEAPTPAERGQVIGRAIKSDMNAGDVVTWESLH